VNATSPIRAGEQTKYISLDLMVGQSGESLALGTGTERLLVILSGHAGVVVDGADLGTAGGRADVFEGAGDAVYLPPASSVVLTALDDGFTVAVVSAPAGSQEPGPARIIAAATQGEVVVGGGSWGRTVRNILGPDDPASRLIVGETVHNGTGTWSSFPPHRHDRDSADEVQLEEVYHYRVQPANGFAMQARYDTDTGQQDVWMVHDGESAAITAGFHPVVAAPGHRLWYLWILAGEQRVMRVYVDPRYRWVMEQPRP
jgi:5-deoxy-glucuronate isomerase